MPSLGCQNRRSKWLNFLLCFTSLLSVILSPCLPESWSYHRADCFPPHFLKIIDTHSTNSTKARSNLTWSVVFSQSSRKPADPSRLLIGRNSFAFNDWISAATQLTTEIHAIFPEYKPRGDFDLPAAALRGFVDRCRVIFRYITPQCSQWFFPFSFQNN